MTANIGQNLKNFFFKIGWQFEIIWKKLNNESHGPTTLSAFVSIEEAAVFLKLKFIVSLVGVRTVLTTNLCGSKHKPTACVSAAYNVKILVVSYCISYSISALSGHLRVKCHTSCCQERMKIYWIYQNIDWKSLLATSHVRKQPCYVFYYFKHYNSTALFDALEKVGTRLVFLSGEYACILQPCIVQIVCFLKFCRIKKLSKTRSLIRLNIQIIKRSFGYW